MEKEKEVLLNLYKKAKTGREGMRYHAVLLIKEGKTLVSVAKLFYVDEETVRRWVNEWNIRKDVKDKPRDGRPKKISGEIEKEICNLVDENKPEEHGINASTWDCKELRIWLKNKYMVRITSERVRQILKSKGFKYVKVNYKYNKADEVKRTEFLDNFRELTQNKDTLILQDEMTSKLHPNKGYVWTREKRAFIETDCSHEKTYVISGANPNNGEVYTQTNEKFNSNVFIDFLKFLLSSVTGKIMLILDNHPSHHSKATTNFLEKNPRIKAIFLPEYSPDLNPKENFWNYIRKKFLNNKVFKTVDDMVKGVMDFIKSIPKEVVKDICSYDYLLA